MSQPLKTTVAVLDELCVNQRALKRALAVIRLNQARHADSSSLLAAVLTVAGEGAAAPSEQALAAAKAELESFLQQHCPGVNCQAHAVSAADAGRALNTLCKHLEASLIIKAADPHGALIKLVRPPLDLQLMRHAPAPLLVAGHEEWTEGGIIAVAVDFAAQGEQSHALNLRLLRQAQRFSMATGAQIHLLQALSPVFKSRVYALDGYAERYDGHEQEALRLQELIKRQLRFAAAHGLSAERCHVQEGRPDEVIPALCAALKPTLLLLGTRARKAFKAALWGNVCERVLDGLSCDVAVLTPKSVAREAVALH